MILFFLIAILSFLLQLFLPWWSLAIASFGCAYSFGKKATQSFFAGLLGCGIVWLLMALFIHFSNGDLMTNRIGELLKLPSSSILYAASFLVAGIVGGLAAVSGYYLKAIVQSRNTDSVSS